MRTFFYEKRDQIGKINFYLKISCHCAFYTNNCTNKQINYTFNILYTVIVGKQ